MRRRQPLELCNGQPGVDFCMRQTVKFSNEIKVMSNVCEEGLGFWKGST